MAKSIFITATGTDVGKTFISALIVKKLSEYNCGYYKPALSGAEEINGRLVPGDCDYVINTAGIKKDPLECVSYVFKPAFSPHLAARIEHNPISLKKILNDFNKIKQEYNYLVVEGAGGIVCPFNLEEEQLLLPDVIKALGLDIIIVADASLGTINSTVLTVEYAKQNGINIKGIILNKYDENNIMQLDNKKCIENLTGIEVIAVVKNGEVDLQIDKETLLGLFKEV